MADLRGIERVVSKVRRRLRQQAAVSAATTAGIPAIAGALVVWWLARMELLGPVQTRLALVALAVAVVLAAVVAAARRFPTPIVASRIDRASGLSDRLGTAVDFTARLRTEHELHPDTVALMRAAVLDGLAAVPRANVKASAPWRAPGDLKALGTFGAVGALLLLLSFGPEPPPMPPALAAAAGPTGPDPDEDILDPDDLDYQREFVEDMKELARQTEDESLRDMAKELEELLAKAERGELGKQELLAKMEEIEKRYASASERDMDAVLADLKEQAKELKKQPITKKLGEALEKGDLEEARKELEALADKVEKGELNEKEKQKLAEALEKAAEKQEQRDAQREKNEDTKAQRQIDEKKEQIRRLEKKVAENPQNEEQKRTLQKERRELERLERQKQEQAERPKRRLERLTRNLKRSAESLRQKNQEQQAAKNMREGAQEQQRVQQEMKRAANQKKVRSQLSDLKDAIRRAKPNRNGRQGQQQARQQRIRELQRRAAGGKANAQAWKPGQGQQGGEPGGKEGQLGQGQKPGGNQWGDEHDPNLTGDPTKLDARLRDEQLTGKHGEGPSRRETILTSAKKGFASTSYRKVYADYKKIVEEVMTQEKVPQGYKYYVKRYFQRIKPHSMD